MWEVLMKLILSSTAWPIIIILALQSFGCAWLSNSTTDQIRVQSLDPEARLYVNDQFIGKGSGTATVKRDRAAMIMAMGNGVCAPAIQYTGSRFNSTSLRDYVNGAPLLAILADTTGVSQDVG
jgi:hypothetical protein